jgi:hypothetical protein
LNERQFFELYKAADDVCNLVTNSYGKLQQLSTKYDDGSERSETSKSANFNFNDNKFRLRDFVAGVLRLDHKPAKNNSAEHLFAALTGQKRNWQTMSLFGSLNPAIDILTVEDRRVGEYYIFNYEITRTEFNCRIKIISHRKPKK